MMKRVFALLLALAMLCALMVGCAKQETPAAEPSTNDPAAAETTTDETPAADAPAEQEVLEFYHAYWHDEATWYPAVVMREIYQEFADAHADGPVRFEPIAIEDLTGLYSSELASGRVPDMMDCAGSVKLEGAIAQNLLMDLKPYIDENGLEAQVGANYEQNQVDGKIYTVSIGLASIGMWVNTDVLEATGATMPEEWTTWEAFADAMETVRVNGEAMGYYSYGSGQGSIRMFNAALAATPAGAEMLKGPLTADAINSEEFADAFRTVATLDQQNGSANSSVNANDFAADFNNGLSAVFINGVWGASQFAGSDNFVSCIYPNSVAISSANTGLYVANDLSDAQKELALEFIKYMTSEEVQSRYFLETSSNPINENVDIQKLAQESGDPTALKLAEACDKCNKADTIVLAIDVCWGTDVGGALQNKFAECAVAGTDIEAKLAELQAELTALIG